MPSSIPSVLIDIINVKSAYVGGPMRGYADFNFPLFDAVAADLRDYFFIEVYNPAEHDREVYPDIASWEGFASGAIERCPQFDFHAAMLWDLNAVLKADALVLLPGWENSTGANHERYVAEVCGKHIYLAHLQEMGEHEDAEWQYEIDNELRVSVR